MNIALAEGDYAAVVDLLRRFRRWLEVPEFRNRQLLYDVFTGFFYGQINLPQLASPWLLSGTAEDVDPGAPDGETMIRAKYLITAQKYHKSLELLADLCHGLSRNEIAATRYLSINTVKTTLNMIYSKLGAGNNVDAVKIAIEKKLVDGL